MPQKDEKPFRMSRSESKVFMGYIQAKVGELVDAVRASPIEQYPQRLFAGLQKVQASIITDTAQAGTDARAVFCKRYINPLVEYLAQKLDALKPTRKAHWAKVAGHGIEELVATFVSEAVADFDFVRDILEGGGRKLHDHQETPGHRPILIPMKECNGATSSGTTIFLTNDELVIHTSNGQMHYPLPRDFQGSEIAIKGGLARLVAKVIFNIPVDNELPLSDVDLVVFGPQDDQTRLKALSDRYEVDPSGVEHINIRGYAGYR